MAYDPTSFAQLLQQWKPKQTYGTYNPAAGFQRDATLAQNAYSRFLSQQRGARDLANIDVQRTQGLEKLGAGYGRRGLTHSGVFNQAQNQYGQDWMSQRQDSMDNLYQQLMQLSNSDANAWNQFGQQVNSDAEDKYQQILQTASQLSQLRPFMG